MPQDAGIESQRARVLATFAGDDAVAADDAYAAIYASIAAWNLVHKCWREGVMARGGLFTVEISFDPDLNRCAPRFIGRGRGFTAAAEDLCKQLWKDLDETLAQIARDDAADAVYAAARAS